jgi:hypothetical protein
MQNLKDLKASLCPLAFVKTKVKKTNSVSHKNKKKKICLRGHLLKNSCEFKQFLNELQIYIYIYIKKKKKKNPLLGSWPTSLHVALLLLELLQMIS